MVQAAFHGFHPKLEGISEENHALCIALFKQLRHCFALGYGFYADAPASGVWATVDVENGTAGLAKMAVSGPYKGKPTESGSKKVAQPYE